MVLHGGRDVTVPIAFGERLFGLIRAPKRFIRLPNAGHAGHDEHGALELVTPFLADGTL
jgi:pimeloyl-ACP methyl ester carboxylesterase